MSRSPLLLDDATAPLADAALTELLMRVYVEGGFTPPDIAEKMFAPGAVRARGKLLYALGSEGTLLGMVMLVLPTSPARKLAAPDEAEMHLLAVDPSARGRGIGRALVAAAVEGARSAGIEKMVLWTQTTMHEAHRLYERTGFRRSPEEDFAHGERQFWMYRRG